MQVTGTFPELSAGRSKSRPKREPIGGVGGFAINGRARRLNPDRPKTYAGRRAASHAKAYRKY